MLATRPPLSFSCPMTDSGRRCTKDCPQPLSNENQRVWSNKAVGRGRSYLVPLLEGTVPITWLVAEGINRGEDQTFKTAFMNPVTHTRTCMHIPRSTHTWNCNSIQCFAGALTVLCNQENTRGGFGDLDCWSPKGTCHSFLGYLLSTLPSLGPQSSLHPGPSLSHTRSAPPLLLIVFAASMEVIALVGQTLFAGFILMNPWKMSLCGYFRIFYFIVLGDNSGLPFMCKTNLLIICFITELMCDG